MDTFPPVSTTQSICPFLLLPMCYMLHTTH